MSLPNSPGIYCITNIKNGKFYVGSAVNLRKRWCQHRCQLSNNCHDNPKLQRSWNKHGEQCFVVSVIEHLESSDNQIEREQYWIDELDVVRRGYNLCPVAGRTSGIKRSEETKKLLSDIAKKRGISPEHRIKLGMAMRGRKLSPEHIAKVSNALKGREVSVETRAKISAANVGKKRDRDVVERHRALITGRKQSPDAIAKQVIAMTGKTRSDIAKKNMSVARKGYRCPDSVKEKLRLANLGKKQSVETIEKRTAAMLSMSAERRAEYMEKLRVSSIGRKRSEESIMKALETRRRNQIIGELKLAP